MFTIAEILFDERDGASAAIGGGLDDGALTLNGNLLAALDEARIADPVACLAVCRRRHHRTWITHTYCFVVL